MNIAGYINILKVAFKILALNNPYNFRYGIIYLFILPTTIINWLIIIIILSYINILEVKNYLVATSPEVLFFFHTDK